VYLPVVPPAVPEGAPAPSPRLRGTLVQEDGNWQVRWRDYNGPQPPTAPSLEVIKRGLAGEDDRPIGTIAAMPDAERAVNDEGTPLWGLVSPSRTIELTVDNEYRWENIKEVFTVVEAGVNEEISTAQNPNRRHRLLGEAELDMRDGLLEVEWNSIAAEAQPTLAQGTGLFRDYSGASLTAHAFDRQFPGLGKWLVTVAAWLFAISTMISWSYYGEQGMIYMLGEKSVLPYKLFYLAAIIYAAEWIVTTGDMEVLMDIGTGSMLWSNIPIVLVLGYLAIGDYHKYMRRLRAGEFEPERHKAPPITDVAEGKDVEKKD
jgi:AGCS family alanine or glycine:cation symporter